MPGIGTINPKYIVDPTTMRSPSDGPAPTAPPNLSGASGTSSGGLAGQDQQNIGWLLNPSFDTREVDQNAAEKAVGGGTTGSGFALNNRNLMLDSEKISRMKLGHDLLNPYLDRSQQAALQSQAESARMQQTIAEGNQAMERLRLSESGQSARLSQEAQDRLQQIALQGEQARILAGINNSSELERQRAAVSGNLANTALSSFLRDSGGGGGGGGVVGSGRYSGGNGRTPGSITSDWSVGEIGGPFVGGFGSTSSDALGTPMNRPYENNFTGYGGGGGGDYNNVSQLAQDILRKYTT